jgi:ABC-type branched-subunit amino acid transport system substrate-binding protein
MKKINRRNFLKGSTVAGAAIVISGFPVSLHKSYAQKSVKSLLIGLAPDMTGPYGEIESLRAAQDYFNWVNETSYIPGVSLKIMWADTGGNLDKGLAFFRREREAGCLVVEHATTGENVALKKLLEEAKIVGFSQSVTEEPLFEPPGWIFSGIVGTKMTCNCFLNAVKGDWAKRKMNRPPVVGTLVWDNIIGKTGSKYVQGNYERFGFKFGVETLMGPTAMEFGSQIRALRDAKCDYVYIMTASPQTGAIVKTKHEMGEKEMRLIFCSYAEATGPWGAISDLPAEMLQGVGVLDSYGHPNEGGKPGAWLLKQCLETYKRSHGEEMSWRVSGTYLMHYAIQWQLVEGIKDAVTRVGAEKITSEDIKNALEKLKRKDVGGLFGGCDFTEYPGDRLGMTHFRYCDVVAAPGGAIRVPKTDWIYCDYRSPVVK